MISYRQADLLDSLKLAIGDRVKADPSYVAQDYKNMVGGFETWKEARGIIESFRSNGHIAKVQWTSSNPTINGKVIEFNVNRLVRA